MSGRCHRIYMSHNMQSKACVHTCCTTTVKLLRTASQAVLAN